MNGDDNNKTYQAIEMYRLRLLLCCLPALGLSSKSFLLEPVVIVAFWSDELEAWW